MPFVVSRPQEGSASAVWRCAPSVAQRGRAGVAAQMWHVLPRGDESHVPLGALRPPTGPVPLPFLALHPPDPLGKDQLGVHPRGWGRGQTVGRAQETTALGAGQLRGTAAPGAVPCSLSPLLFAALQGGREGADVPSPAWALAPGFSARALPSSQAVPQPRTARVHACWSPGRLLTSTWDSMGEGHHERPGCSLPLSL